MAKETKEVSKRRDAMKKSITEMYRERKRRYPEEIPKFLKATNVTLDLFTFRDLVKVEDLINDKTLKEVFVKES